jgi:ATP-binding cassette subfamily B protein
VIVAHRLATIALADRVVLLEEGRVAAAGRHDDLLRESRRYREVLARVAAGEHREDSEIGWRASMPAERADAS